jgi:hypothetical protein
MRDDLLIPIDAARKILERTRLIKGSSGPYTNLQGTVGVHGTGMGAASFRHSTAPVAGYPLGASSGSPTGISTTASTTATANLFAVDGSTGTAALASSTTATAPAAIPPFGACSGSPAGTTTASTFNFGTPRSATVQPSPNLFGSASTTVPKPTGLLSAAPSPSPLPPPPPPAAPTPISTPGGGPAFDSLVLTLDESDAVRVAVEGAKNDPDEVARLRPTSNVEVTVSAGVFSVTAPPLFLACNSDGGDLKKAALLLLAGADINGGGAGNSTPLHTASCAGLVDHVRLLLAWGGADLHAKSGFGSTPLQFAIRNGHVEIQRLLREAGAAE